MQAASAALPAEATPTPKGSNAPLQQPMDTLEQPRHSGTFWAVEPPLPIVEPGKKLTRNSRFVPLCFDNPESAYRDISTYSLARGIAVLTVCKFETLVKNADRLYSLSRRLLGPIPAVVMRYTFFAHFCAGEDQEVRQWSKAHVLNAFLTNLMITMICYINIKTLSPFRYLEMCSPFIRAARQL